MTTRSIEFDAASKVVPVVTVDDVADAAPLHDALVDAGISSIEVTLRSAAAWDVISALVAAGGLRVGVGTVRSAHQVDRAIDAGAAFAVSPGFDREVALVASSRGLAYAPGIATASELQDALRLGFRTIKVFPVEQLGGPGLLKAFAAPFPEAKLFPSGGIDDTNAANYLKLSAVVGIGTGWVAPRNLIATHDTAEITRRGRELLALTPQANS